jgi:hypothetical protein
MQMFKADITLQNSDGSIGAKVIFGASLGQVMDDAEYLVSYWILEGRQTNNPVVSHKVIGGVA